MKKRIRSEEHTSELQSQSNIVCRLLLEKKAAMSERPSMKNLRPWGVVPISCSLSFFSSCSLCSTQRSFLCLSGPLTSVSYLERRASSLRQTYVFFFSL